MGKEFLTRNGPNLPRPVNLELTPQKEGILKGETLPLVREKEPNRGNPG